MEIRRTKAGTLAARLVDAARVSRERTSAVSAEPFGHWAEGRWTPMRSATQRRRSGFEASPRGGEKRPSIGRASRLGAG